MTLLDSLAWTRRTMNSDGRAGYKNRQPTVLSWQRWQAYPTKGGLVPRWDPTQTSSLKHARTTLRQRQTRRLGTIRNNINFRHTNQATIVIQQSYAHKPQLVVLSYSIALCGWLRWAWSSCRHSSGLDCFLHPHQTWSCIASLVSIGPHISAVQMFSLHYDRSQSRRVKLLHGGPHSRRRTSRPDLCHLSRTCRRSRHWGCLWYLPGSWRRSACNHPPQTKSGRPGKRRIS